MAKKGTSKKIRDLNPVKAKPYGVYSRFDEYYNLLMNGVKIVKKSTKEEINFSTERYIKSNLFDGGAVGYDALTKKWASVHGQGVNEEGNPTDLIFTTMNCKTWTRKANYEPTIDGAFIFYALPVSTMTMSSLIKEVTDFVTNCDVAIRQNLNACKTPYIVVCKDDDLRLSLETALEQKEDGQAVIVVSQQLGEGLKAVDISVMFMGDKFSGLRDEAIDALLNKLGIMTNTTEKRERVQSAEVNAIIGQATDYIYLLIDTFNKQSKSYGLDFEMQLNGSLEELYSDITEDEINAEDGGEGNTENDV